MHARDCTSDGFESRNKWRSLYAARFEPSWFSIRVPCASAFLLFSVSSGDSNAVICGRDRGWVVISRIITHHAYNEQRNINIHKFCFYDRASLYTEYHLNSWTLIQARISATNVEQSKRPTSPLLNLKACPWLMSSFVTSPLCVHITRGVFRKCAIFCGCVSCHFQK